MKIYIGPYPDGEEKRELQVEIHSYDTWSMDSTLSLIILPMLKQLKETKHGAPYTDDEDVPDYLRSTSAPAKKNEWDTDALHFLRWDWIMAEMIWAFEQIVKDDGEGEFVTWDETAEPNSPFLKELGCGSCIWDMEGLREHQTRKRNALTLFGKYFQNLWD